MSPPLPTAGEWLGRPGRRRPHSEEVSLDRDRDRKRRAYARAGIPVYLIIDDYDFVITEADTEAVTGALRGS
ncbi:hypothetical protein [Streptomyces sp. NPDC001502]|uniref:hypothetical protein n=1 Tax=Streptomyces sp. NPDC001502 TaxID=3364578 RepID=UPI003685864F